MSMLVAKVTPRLHTELGVQALVHGVESEANGDRVSLIGDATKIKYLLSSFAARHAGAVSDVMYYDSNAEYGKYLSNVEYDKTVEMTHSEMTRNIGIKNARPKRP
jgi:hypothetical protein